MKIKSIVIGLWLLLPYNAVLGGARLVMGVEDLPYLPYYALKNGTYIGYSRELFDAFARDLGYRIEYRPLPVERLFFSLLHGQIDLKYPDSPEWRQELKGDRPISYSQTIAPYTDGIMVRPDRLGASLKRLHTLGTIRGFTPRALVDSIRQGYIVLTENNSIPGLLRQVLAGRIDGAYLNVAVARFQLQALLGQERALMFDPELPHTTSGYVVSTTRCPEVIPKLDAWLKRQATLVNELRKKWGIDEH